MVVMVMIIIVVMLVMVIMVIRTDRQTKLTFKLDFPGNLCRAAFTILAMFLQLYL